MLIRFQFLGLLILLAGCASQPMASNAKTTEARTPSSTFANEAFYNRGFDAAVVSQLGGTKLCRCNDSTLKNRIGIAGITETARNSSSTTEYKLGCGVRTTSENAKPDDQITTVSCNSFDLL